MFVSNAHTIVQYCINGVKQMNDPTDGKQWYSCPTSHIPWYTPTKHTRARAHTHTHTFF